MKHLRLNLILSVNLLLLILLLTTACNGNKQPVPPAEMVGTWVGLGRTMISNEYLNQREIPFMLSIEQNGTVTGYVGDSSMMKTKLEITAWWLRLIGKDKYRVAVSLNGNIVNRESFRRDGGTIVFESITDEELLCSFTSTGTQINTENLTLSVQDIKLHRAQ